MPMRGSGDVDSGSARRSPPKEERRRDAERTRAALLAAALEEFAARGFTGARVAEIADRAGVDKQLISYYFGGKAGLYRELQLAVFAAEVQSNDPDQRLPEVAGRYLRRVLADPRTTRLLLWSGLSGPGNDEDGERHGPALGELDLGSMRARQDDGELPDDIDPAALLLMIMGAVTAPVALPQVVRAIFGFGPDEPEFEQRYARTLQTVLDRIRAARPDEEETA